MSKDKRVFVYFDHSESTFVGITPVVIQQLSEAYVGVDVESELRKMALWLQSAKGKSRQGTINFIMNWLERALPTLKPSDSYAEPNTPLSDLYADYLSGLWKNSEHILEMNTKR